MRAELAVCARVYLLRCRARRTCELRPQSLSQSGCLGAQADSALP